MGGRKHLTHLSHMEGFGLDPDELAAVLQVRYLRCVTCRLLKAVVSLTRKGVDI